MDMIVKGLENPEKAFRALMDKALNALGLSHFRPFVVLSRSRTGSTMLISYLNSHPNIRAEGEIFRRLNGRNYEDVLAEVFAKQPYYVKAKGFKMFYYHPLDDTGDGVWDCLESMENLRIIHLKRRNILRTLVSWKIADLQDVWAATTSSGLNSGGNKAVSLTVQEIEDGIRQTRAWEEKGDERFRHHPLLEVCYEDLVADPTGQFKRITGFLGVRYMRPHTDLKRQNPERLSELLLNYSELQAECRVREWLRFLEE